MLGAIIVVFREIIEAGLIVGIVLAVTRGIPSRGLWVAGGIAAGVLGSAILALFAGALADAFDGSGEELFNAWVLSTAVLMLAWHTIWMARHGRQMANDMRHAGEEVAAGSKSLFALAVVVGIAVLREGAEVVLFLYGILVSSAGTSLAGLLGGFAIGVLLGAGLSTLTYLGLVRIPARRIFAITSAMITLLAAGMAAQAAGFFERAGLLSLWDETAWDSSALLSEGSIPGRVLHSLIGYTEQPSYMQLVVYLVTLVAIVILARTVAPQRPAATLTLSAPGQ